MFQGHSETSKKSYYCRRPDGGQRERVYRHILASGRTGICAGQIAHDLGIQTGTVAARLIELERLNRAVKLSREAPTPSGHSGNVYIADTFIPFMLATDTIEQTKPSHRAARNAQDSQTLDLLRDVQTAVQIGADINPRGELALRISAAIARLSA